MEKEEKRTKEEVEAMQWAKEDSRKSKGSRRGSTGGGVQTKDREMTVTGGSWTRSVGDPDLCSLRSALAPEFCFST